MTLPQTAYVSLWFPKPSETFIFREVATMHKLGLPVRAFNLYAPLKHGLSPEMAAFPPAESLGTVSTHKVLGALASNFSTATERTWTMMKNGPFNKWRHLEGLGENLWAFCCGLHLARRFKEEGIEHIHAPWANGPATAAWVASKLTSIPFSFAARAGDIYPAEGAMGNKIRDAAFVRVNHGANIPYMRSFAPKHASKIKLVYNALSLGPKKERRAAITDNLSLLAAGRFVRTKGFDGLLDACALLRKWGVNFTLTLAGDGALAGKLKRQTTRLGLDDRVSFPGFLRHDDLSDLMLKSSALVMPSVVAPNGDRDGIPNVIMEAYAHGLPVVATDVAGISEVVINDKTGFLVKQRDPDGLANAMQKLAEKPEAARQLAKNGRAHVMELFDQERNACKMMELFAAHAGRAH